MADFPVTTVTVRRMRSSSMPRCRSLHLPEKKKKKMSIVFLKRCFFYAHVLKSLCMQSRKQNGGFSCEYCNCQAHAQLYAAPQVPSPAGEKEKDGGRLSICLQEQKTKWRIFL
jgi:hypothetical protein